MVSTGDSASLPEFGIVTEIVEQHAEEAAFLWCLRDAATERPHYTLRDLNSLDERVEAQLDGLRLAGKTGFEIARQQLNQHKGPGELFVVSTLSLESRSAVNIDNALDIAESAPELRRGFFGALGWVTRDALRGHAITWLDDPSPFRRLAGVVACSLHRADPTARIGRLLDDQPSVRARALRLVGELGRVDLRDRLRAALNDESEACRFWAAWSAGLLGDKVTAIPALQAYAVGNSAFKWRAVDLVVRLMDIDSAIAWIRDLGRDPNNARLLITTAGTLGNPVVVPWLIDKMRILSLARLAGESFSMITGLNLSSQALDGNRPDDFVGGPTDEPGDENVAIDIDENLPWPSPNKIQARWEAEQRNFTPGVRHLLGLPLTRENREYAWREGYQRQRRAAAYDLAILSVGHPLRNWRARLDVQKLF